MKMEEVTKTIEEMAKTIYENTDISDIDIAKGIATELYNEGWRKQRQGEWKEVRIVRYNGKKPYTQIAHECSNCKWLNKHTKGWNANYCPNCGAKMKGN